MVLQDLGGVIFFTDPLFSHPHAADIATLLRMCDLHNILHASNPTTARALIPVLRDGADGAECHGPQGALSCSCTCAHMQPLYPAFLDWHLGLFLWLSPIRVRDVYVCTCVYVCAAPYCPGQHHMTYCACQHDMICHAHPRHIHMLTVHVCMCMN